MFNYQDFVGIGQSLTLTDLLTDLKRHRPSIIWIAIIKNNHKKAVNMGVYVSFYVSSSSKDGLNSKRSIGAAAPV